MVNILLILVLIALNAFFVSVEFAAVSSRRTRLELITDDKNRAYHTVHGWLENSATRDRLIAATQLGITIVSLALGAVGENTFQAWLEPVFAKMVMPAWLKFLEVIIPAMPLVLSLIIVTSVHVVLGEQVPKVAVLRMPESFALRAAPVMNIFGKIFKWFIDLLDWATRLILGLVGLPPDASHTTVYSLEEIKEMVSGPEVEGVVKEQEREMLSAVIDFGELLVRQVLIPRTEIIAVEADTPIREAIQFAVENAHTKLPVYEDSLDQVIGIIHLQDLVARAALDKKGLVARDVMREALFVPETISVNSLLHQFKARKKHIAIVLDEYGGTSGIVTLEDLVEEIIGEIEDPFAKSPPSVQNMPDGTFLIDGLSLIEDVDNNFGLNLQNEDYDTIAGFVLGKLGRIAKIGDVVEEPSENIRLCVEEMDGMRIARLKLSFIPQAAPHTAEQPVEAAAH